MDIKIRPPAIIFTLDAETNDRLSWKFLPPITFWIWSLHKQLILYICNH